MFYEDKDYFSVRKQFYITAAVIVLLLIAFFAIACKFMITLPWWIGLVFLLVGTSICIFIWGVYAVPMFRYSSLVRDFITGRTRELTGTVKTISREPYYKENKLYFYEIFVDEDEIERLLLYDANKGEPKLVEGETYKFILHEYYIIDVIKT